MYSATVIIPRYRELLRMTYTPAKTTLPEGRQRLTALIRAAGDVVSVDDAVRLLGLERPAAAKALARWTSQGWLRRVGHGVYVPASLDSLESEHVLQDAWVLVPVLFGPAYVGGRTAAEFWDLTEQIFNDVLVLTTKPLRSKVQRHHGVTFNLKHVNEAKIFGTKSIWRAHTKVQVSDLHRTIVDMLDDPAIGGGIQHIADCLAAYLRHPGRDDQQLVSYAERLGNGAIFKRLGFLVENNTTARGLAAACAARLTAGNAKLDPALDCPYLASRWRLWIPSFPVGSARL